MVIPVAVNERVADPSEVSESDWQEIWTGWGKFQLEELKSRVGELLTKRSLSPLMERFTVTGLVG